MKIIIIGLGLMGQAHLNALINIKIIKEVNIFDINKKTLKDLKKKYKNKIKILSSLKGKNNYQLAIIATNSLERSKVFRELLKFNNVKNILIEKFPFAKIKEFKIFQREFKNRFINNIDVNTWGHFIVKHLRLRIKPTNIIVKTNSKNFLSNFIHYADIFLFYNEKNKYSIDLSKLNKKIFKSSRKNYHEKRGEINIESKNLKLSYQYDKKIKNIFEICYLYNGKVFFKMILNKDTKLEIINKKKRIYKFPISAILTKKYFYETLKNKPTNFFSSLEILKFSKLFLLELSKMKIKNFYIT